LRVSFDPDKNDQDIRQRGLSFELASEFDFATAAIQADSRREYGETRFVALGTLHERLHVLCLTETPDGIRVISFRKANDRELKRCAKIQSPD